MDFIKTSSLRALIELTFQRNWNGFIWMSRKGVIAKRVKAAPDGHIENQRPNAQTGWPRNECSALGQNRSVRLKSRPKFKPSGRSRNHDPGNIVPRSAKFQRHAKPRTTKRASRETSLAAAQLVPRTTADASVRAGKTSHVRPRNHRPNSSVDQPADRKHPARPFRLGQRPDCPADRPDDRPNAAVDPKPFLKPNPHNSSPKPAPT
ncbi:unnamed protein product [Microthlaspi erraticum]|uniref:Uncharacterized protein n=1 Tax=Microthlaspi erraticum TaxID=1685480 RepID=A0A6D2J353_9BRAS|nr:unnamed protein product [Microthlaspi erraticum]